MIEPKKPKISDFVDPITGAFNVQAYDSAMDGYEDELESWGNYSDDVYFFNDLEQEDN